MEIWAGNLNSFIEKKSILNEGEIIENIIYRVTKEKFISRSHEFVKTIVLIPFIIVFLTISLQSLINYDTSNYLLVNFLSVLINILFFVIGIHGTLQRIKVHWWSGYLRDNMNHILNESVLIKGEILHVEKFTNRYKIKYKIIKNNFESEKFQYFTRVKNLTTSNEIYVVYFNKNINFII